MLRSSPQQPRCHMLHPPGSSSSAGSKSAAKSQNGNHFNTRQSSSNSSPALTAGSSSHGSSSGFHNPPTAGAKYSSTSQLSSTANARHALNKLITSLRIRTNRHSRASRSTGSASDDAHPSCHSSRHSQAVPNSSGYSAATGERSSAHRHV